MSKTYSRLLLTLVALLCTSSAAWPIQTPAAGPSFFFPPIGGVRGQTLRFTALAPKSFRTVPAPCLTTLSFVDLEGRQIGPSREVRLTMGESTFLDLDFNALVAGFGIRAEVRPVLTQREGSGLCIPSVEIFEPLTGRTSAAINYDSHLPEVQKVIEDGTLTDDEYFVPLVGGSLGQKVRFGLVRVTPLEAGATPFPCSGEMGFLDSRGNAVGQTRRVDLAPGQAAFLDLNLNALVGSIGERVGITPVFGAAPNDSKGCVGSIQVIDQLSGRTSVYYGNSIIQPPDQAPPRDR